MIKTNKQTKNLHVPKKNKTKQKQKQKQNKKQTDLGLSNPDTPRVKKDTKQPKHNIIKQFGEQKKKKNHHKQ